MQPLLAYLAHYPFVAALLGALVLMFVWSVVKGLLKLTVMSAAVLAISFFVTHQKATDAWVERAGAVAQRAAAAIAGEGALASGDSPQRDAGTGGR